jgi:hypothetical protein
MSGKTVDDLKSLLVLLIQWKAQHTKAIGIIP